MDRLKIVMSLVFVSGLAFSYAGCTLPGSSSSSTSTSTNNSSGGGSGGSGGSGGGDTGLTASALVSATTANPFYQCVNITDNTYGTDFNGGSMYRDIYFSSTTQYSMNVQFNFGSCLSNAGEAFSYSQSGTYSITGSTSTPSGGYQVEYTPTTGSSTLWVYGGITGDASNTIGTDFLNDFKTINCALTPNPSTLSASAESSEGSLSGRSCDATGGNSGNLLLSFPTEGIVYYDVIVPNNVTAPTAISVSASSSAFHMGQVSTYPTTATVNLPN